MDCKLPKHLKATYKQSDFIIQQRAKLAYYLCDTAILVTFLLLIKTGYNQITSDEYEELYLPVLLPIIGCFIAYSICLILLIKGHLSLSSNLMLISAFVMIWLAIMGSKETSISRIDTLAYIFVILSLTPLMITKNKYLPFLYALLCVGFLIFFVLTNKNEIGIYGRNLTDFIIDTSLAFVLVGFIGYNIFILYHTALKQTQKDVEERKATELALAKSEKKYREMANLLPQIITEVDLLGNVTYVNKAGLIQFEYSEGEYLQGVNVASIIMEKERLFENMEKVTKGTYSNEQYTAIKRNGEIFPVQVYATAIKENGKPVGIRAIVINISDRIKVENELKQSNQRFKTLLESIPISTSLSDLNHKFIMVNQAFCRDIDLPSEQIIGKYPKDIGIKSDPGLEEKIHDLLQNKGAVENFEITAYNRHGKKSDLYVNALLIEINGQKIIIRSNINITEKNALEKKLKESEIQLRKYNEQLETLVQERTDELITTNEELQATNEELYRQREQLEATLQKLKETQEQLIHTEKMASLGILTAGVAHEINNPINFIYNGTMAIENYINNNLPEHLNSLRPLLDAINSGIQRTTKIVKSLNIYSRKEEISFSKCNIHAVLENCLTMLYNQYKHRIKIYTDYDEDIPEVMGIEGKLHQAFLNILINAIQAIPENGEIFLQTHAVKDTCQIHVKDTGQGISSENLRHIFDPFFTTKDPGKGTGLGLSITQTIIHEHKGSLKCKSEVNKGTEFIIILPVNQSENL